MRERDKEAMCETSEESERLIQPREVLPITLEVGRRIMEVFGYQKISNIVFRLRSTHDEIDAVLNGKSLPSTELLLGIQKVTGASIDWLLTGEGSKYIKHLETGDLVCKPGLPAVRSGREEREHRLLQ